MCFIFLGRFIKDIADQNTLKIVDVQFDDGGSYVCRASTELDFDDASATLVVQDRPNRPRITKVNCSGSTQNSYGQPFAIVQWEATGIEYEIADYLMDRNFTRKKFIYFR